MHAGCCEIFGKRKNTQAAGECIFTLSENRGTSQVKDCVAIEKDKDCVAIEVRYHRHCHWITADS